MMPLMCRLQIPHFSALVIFLAIVVIGDELHLVAPASGPPRPVSLPTLPLETRQFQQPPHTLQIAIQRRTPLDWPSSLVHMPSVSRCRVLANYAREAIKLEFGDIDAFVAFYLSHCVPESAEQLLMFRFDYLRFTSGNLSNAIATALSLLGERLNQLGHASLALPYILPLDVLSPSILHVLNAATYESFLAPSSHLSNASWLLPHGLAYIRRSALSLKQVVTSNIVQHTWLACWYSIHWTPESLKNAPHRDALAAKVKSHININPEILALHFKHTAESLRVVLDAFHARVVSGKCNIRFWIAYYALPNQSAYNEAMEESESVREAVYVSSFLGEDASQALMMLDFHRKDTVTMRMFKAALKTLKYKTLAVLCSRIRKEPPPELMNTLIAAKEMIRQAHREELDAAVKECLSA